METKNLVWEDLQLDGLKILQDKNGYRFTSDAVILANFVQCKSKDIVLEFCAGSGVISTLVSHKENPKHIYAFELQENVSRRASESVKANNMQKRITVINKSNSFWREFVKQESADIVVCNPPYQKLGSGKVPENKEVAISKSELETTLSEIILQARVALKYGGSLYICMHPQRFTELICELQKQNFGVESLFFSYATPLSNASCVFVKAIKDKKQETNILPALITHNDKGDYVMNIKKLFKNQN